MSEGFVFQFSRMPQVLEALFFIPSVGHTFPFEGRKKKTDPVISNLLAGRGDGFTGSIITCYTERSIMEYE